MTTGPALSQDGAVFISRFSIYPDLSGLIPIISIYPD